MQPPKFSGMLPTLNNWSFGKPTGFSLEHLLWHFPTQFKTVDIARIVAESPEGKRLRVFGSHSNLSAPFFILLFYLSPQTSALPERQTLVSAASLPQITAARPACARVPMPSASLAPHPRCSKGFSCLHSAQFQFWPGFFLHISANSHPRLVRCRDLD